MSFIKFVKTNMSKKVYTKMFPVHIADNSGVYHLIK